MYVCVLFNPQLRQREPLTAKGSDKMGGCIKKNFVLHCTSGLTVLRNVPTNAVQTNLILKEKILYFLAQHGYKSIQLIFISLLGTALGPLKPSSS